MNIKLKLLSSLFKLNIVSSLPGRLRVHIPKYNKFLQQLNLQNEDIINLISMIDGVISVEGNIHTENFLILYDINTITEAKIISIINTSIKNIFLYMDKEKQNNIDTEKLKEVVRKTIDDII